MEENKSESIDIDKLCYTFEHLQHTHVRDGWRKKKKKTMINTTIQRKMSEKNEKRRE